ncbi:MAG: hypothetical protein BAJATHORv1_30219 [Candidatus Thorarchaeota archaeon]|nr:MAG: hypothetical protein BAJATHORv1_30219 [Candidatus Thorarchaeota archaeon]
MQTETDLEKLAVSSRQRLTREFAEKYTNLQERSRRISVVEAKKIAEEYSCPLQIAMISYLINLDGILSLKDAILYFMTELNRRASIGEEIPNIPGNIMEFALLEGRWIEYVYGSFVRNFDFKLRELANLEGAIDESNISLEKAIHVVASRTKLAEGYLAPVVEAWLSDHPKSNTEDALMFLGPAITRWKSATLKGRVLHLRRRCQALFRILRKAMGGPTESATIDSSLKRLDTLISDLDSELNTLSIPALSHLLLHIAPKPTGRGDKSSFVEVGAGSTRGGKTEPDMVSPFDFLERDVYLAKRRSRDERIAYLTERIERVVRVLIYQGIPLQDCVMMCIRELNDRLKLDIPSLDELADKTEERLNGVASDNRNSLVVQIIYEYIDEYAYEAKTE